MVCSRRKPPRSRRASAWEGARDAPAAAHLATARWDARQDARRDAPQCATLVASGEWGEVEGATGSHFVEVTAIKSDARQRLVDIGKDEQARLFSVRITGEMRVWGIRDRWLRHPLT